jgi:holo-[acyl-carrier protein] synthase
MILGIGNDIVAISRIKKIFLKFGDKFLKKIYCENEIKIAKNYLNQGNNDKLYSYLAKRLCAKEACAKALGIGLGRGINFNDIAVINNHLGKPEIIIADEKINYVKQIFSCQNFYIHLSLSDEKDLASAMVIIEKIDNKI